MSDDGQRAPEKDIMMAVSSEHAIREAELLTLRQIADALNATNNRLGRLDDHVGKVHDKVSVNSERIARMEERDTQIKELKETVAKLEEKLSDLDADKLKRAGAGQMLTWLKDFTPWVVMILAVLLAASGKVHIG